MRAVYFSNDYVKLKANLFNTFSNYIRIFKLMEILFQTPIGDLIYKSHKSIIIKFESKRRVVSSSVLNGGLREDLSYVFNKDEKRDDNQSIKMLGDTYEEHLAILTKDLKLPVEKTTGLSTACSMENAAILSDQYHDTNMTLLVTAGLEINGGRAGDPASFDEVEHLEHQAGTVNIILHLDCHLPPGVMTRALITITEAKSAALQDLMIDSRYSNQLATGSGTDGIIVICNPQSKRTLTNIGQHAKFGESIGKLVKQGVKDALLKETNISPSFQADFLRRGRRFGITEEWLWKKIKGTITYEQFLSVLKSINKTILPYAVCYFRLMDEINDQLLTANIARDAAMQLLKHMSYEETQDKRKLDTLEDYISEFAQALITWMNPQNQNIS